jgi:hypothetical protein
MIMKEMESAAEARDKAVAEVLVLVSTIMKTALLVHNAWRYF